MDSSEELIRATVKVQRSVLPEDHSYSLVTSVLQPSCELCMFYRISIFSLQTYPLQIRLTIYRLSKFKSVTTVQNYL